MRETIEATPTELEQYRYSTVTAGEKAVTAGEKAVSIVERKEGFEYCITNNHPYSKILKSKMDLMPTIFDLKVEVEKKVPETQYELKLMIQQSEDEKSNIFVYHFTFPTSFSLYEEMQNNFALQKSFDSNIDCYECRDQVDDFTKVIYLSYKKILIVSPRDFVYVRYQFKKDNEFWTIATSIPGEETYEGKVRGSIILTVTRAVEENGNLHLSVYSQIDMKMPIKASAAKARGVTEIKKYLDKCFNYLEKEK